MPDFVTLSCPSCGGKLQITSDVERFACAHCGREHVVNRGAGIVSLSPVVDALKTVGVGVDKTAAELAIVRLNKEIGELLVQKSELLGRSPQPRYKGQWVLFFALVGLSFLCFTALLWWPSPGLGAAAFLVLTLASGFGAVMTGISGSRALARDVQRWEQTTGAQLKAFDQVLAAKYSELQQHEGTVSK